MVLLQNKFYVNTYTCTHKYTYTRACARVSVHAHDCAVRI